MLLYRCKSHCGSTKIECIIVFPPANLMPSFHPTLNSFCCAVVAILFLCPLKSGRAEDQISFELDVQPILTATGCNQGACHGKQRGQNGFQLSLLGFDSNFDFDAITKESRGRRVFPASPKSSLLLQKATSAIPHGGGKRIEIDSPDYKTLLDWVKQGAKRSTENETTLSHIELNHKSLLLKPNEHKKLTVIAHYKDGTRRDVTLRSTFQSNDPAIVAVNEKNGEVTAGKLPGETAIMARYMNVIQVCHIAIPLESKVDPAAYKDLPQNNFIDEFVWKKLQSLNVTPSEPANDATFMRRVYTDIIGRIPTTEEAKRFIDDKDPSKRQKLIDTLLEQPEYAEFWANKWADLLRTNPYRVGIKTTLSYDNWIRQQFRENVPYDDFVQKLITAKGSTWRNGAVTLFRDRRSPDELTTIVTQLFLGIRLECAKCHHHPFEKWSQEDFYSFAAFFGQVSRKGTGLSPPISGSEEIVMDTGSTSVKHPATNQVLSARPLFTLTTTRNDSSDNKETQRLRETLADWITAPDNSYFAQVQVNRVWADLMGRGIVEPVDDIRATNPPSNPELLDALARHFRESKFDLKTLIRTICNSYVYSLSSAPNETNVSDRLNYSRHYRHRMRGEILLDSITQITSIESRFSAVPPGSLSTQIWTHRTPSLFLDTFGRPNPNEDPPCERTTEMAVTQSLHLLNAKDIHKKIRDKNSFAAKLAGSAKKSTDIVYEIYLAVFSRYPDDKETKFATDLISIKNVKDADANKHRKKAIEALIWAMLNTPEFTIQN